MILGLMKTSKNGCREPRLDLLTSWRKVKVELTLVQILYICQLWFKNANNINH